MEKCCKTKECTCTASNCNCDTSKCGCNEKNCACKRSGTTEHDIKTITASELLKKMDADSALIVVNVLGEEYYNKCHIKGSINVPLEQLQGIALESWNKNDKIVVYCAHSGCPLSGNAFKLLDKLGFTHVCAFEGGIKEWCEKKYPVVGNCGD